MKVCVKVKDSDTSFYPEELLGMLLLKLKEIAQTEHHVNIINAVIAVPLSFTTPQRQSVMDAARLAGFTTVRLISDSTAVALYNMEPINRNSHQNNLIFKLGERRSEATIVEIKNSSIVIKAVSTTPCGAHDIKEKLSDALLKQFKKTKGKDLEKNIQAVTKIRLMSEDLVQKLSVTEREEFVFQDLLMNVADFSCGITRDV